MRHYAKVPPLRCLPDQLNQVWTNLIHNSLQAMKHKGRIAVASELGVGTTFSVYLPLDAADTPANARPSPDVQSA